MPEQQAGVMGEEGRGKRGGRREGQLHSPMPGERGEEEEEGRRTSLDVGLQQYGSAAVMNSASRTLNVAVVKGRKVC